MEGAGEPMGDELTRALESLAMRVAALLGGDPQLRADLRRVAELVLAVTAEPPAATAMIEPTVVAAAVEPTAAPAPVAVAAPAVVAPEPPTPREPLPPLTLGQSRPTAVLPTIPAPLPIPATAPVAVRGQATDADLPGIEARCRLKAEGARWAVARERLKAEGADFRAEVAPRDADILDRARAIECYLWTNTPGAAHLADRPGALEDLAACYEVLADVVALMREVAVDPEGHRDAFERGMDLMAEAQSALRVAIDQLEPGRTDDDQFRAYDWLRAKTSIHQIFVRRYMRLNDPADPSRLRDLAAQVARLDKEFQSGRQRAKEQRGQLGRARYHAKLIAGSPGDDHRHDWIKLVEAIDGLVAGRHLPPSSLEARELLLPILDGLPDDLPRPDGFQRALHEVDRYLATRDEAESAAGPAAARAWSPEVARVAGWLAGRDVVLIGGVRRSYAEEALREALGLGQLHWITTREHESIAGFEPIIRRPEVALVLLAIRWSSHSFGDIKKFCDDAGKPLVRLPRGYGPNQVAATIIDQVSAQLDADRG